MSNPLRNKMYDYEVIPPGGLWDQIVTAMNEEDEISELSLKLHDMEATPPASAWQNIKNHLGKKSVQPVLKPQRVIFLYRYAAAVAVTALIVFGGIKLIQKKSSKEELATNKNSILVKDSMTPVANESAATATLNNSKEADEKKDDAALEESKHTIAKNEFSAATKLKLARESYLSAPAHYIENITELTNHYPDLHYSDLLQSLLTNKSTREDLSDRYIMLKTSDGNFVRMSKKLSDLICCISGEEQDSECKDRLQRWREKIASSPLAPTPGNFMDILSLITTLQEDNK